MSHEPLVSRPLPIRGDDIDTDRIIPARFLRTITFEGLEAHLFEDERAAAKASDAVHPVDDPRFEGAGILIVNRNFGCGSSREHAPQAIKRRGIVAIVGQSFSEIFFGNAVAIGLPCVTADAATVDWLMDLAERHPERAMTVDVERRSVTAEGRTIRVDIPESAHQALVSGTWDATRLLRDDFEAVRRLAKTLPYTEGFASS